MYKNKRFAQIVQSLLVLEVFFVLQLFLTFCRYSVFIEKKFPSRFDFFPHKTHCCYVLFICF